MSGKSDIARSEAWLSTITALGSLLTVYLSHVEGATTWLALLICGVLGGVYAFFRTSLASKKRPGVKTKAFWTAIIVVAASIATAISESSVAGIPAPVVKVAGLISATAAALGYNIWRYRLKTAED